IEIRTFKLETDLLEAFLDAYEGINPTIITGWNLDGFDVPYLYNRIKRLLGERQANRLSPIGIVEYNGFRNRHIIAGVSSLDYLELYKLFTYTQESSYTLDAISKKELGRGKVT